MLIMTITTLGIRVLRYKMMVVVLERAGRAYTCTRTYTHAHAYTRCSDADASGRAAGLLSNATECNRQQPYSTIEV